VTTYLGIDLAWGERARTGLAALDATGRLVASGSVVTDDQLVAFVAEHAPGVVVAAIDAPLVVPNTAGQRDCEAELNREFGRYNAGAYPTSRSRPWFNPPRGAALSERFGWSMDPSIRPDGATSAAIEVYPHPAMVSLFDLATVIPYKNKPGRTTTSRKAAFGVLRDAMERECEEPLRLSESARWSEIRAAAVGAHRPIDLRVVEDEIDAIFCAYLAWLWGRRDPQMRILGDVQRGYIVVPGPPRVAPARVAAVRAGLGAQADAMRVAGLMEAFQAAVPSLSDEDAARLAQIAVT